MRWLVFTIKLFISHILTDTAKSVLMTHIFLRTHSIPHRNYTLPKISGNTFHALFSFATEGLQKGVSTISANYIGASRLDLVQKTFSSSIKFLAVILLLLLIPLVCFPDYLVLNFLQQDAATEIPHNLLVAGVHTLKWILVYFMLDGFVWIIAGILTAAGKTVFVMVANMVSAWAFAILPIYLFIVLGQGGPDLTWSLICLYGLMNATIFYVKYKGKGWQANAVVAS